MRLGALEALLCLYSTVRADTRTLRQGERSRSPDIWESGKGAWMSKRPKSRKYRNLSRRGGVIYCERIVDGRRFKFSTKTSNWDDAASVRDLWESKSNIAATVPLLDVPTLEDFAKRYLEEDTAHLAPTTRTDRHSYLSKKGPLIAKLGSVRLAEITVPVLRQWWNEEVTNHAPKLRSSRTGRAYLDALSSIYGYAMDLGTVELNPVPAFRETLRRRARTQRGRAEAEAGRHVHPIERPEDIESLLAAARAESPTAYALVLILLDAGLRLGEALGLTWDRITCGKDEHDESRSLLIDRSRPRGGAVAPTKSGRARSVALSRRLRTCLLDLDEQSPRDSFVLDGIDPSNFRKREWKRILREAKIGRRALKDLRDTYASQLLTSGVQLGYVSAQLGHADVQVTARHYARWVGGDRYRPPYPIGPGEVPAELLARLSESHHCPTTQSGDGETRSRDFNKKLEENESPAAS
jgi:integrase